MRLFIFCCCLAVVSNAFGQIPDAVLPVVLDSLLKTKAPAPEDPGFAVCIVKNGRIFYEKQFGMADLELNRPITSTTSFSMGSVSKQFTAAAIMLLEEQGKLHRSDPIHKYIPELPDFGRPITIDHLVGHTSGIYSLPEVMSLQSNTSNERLTMDYLLSWLKRHPVLAFEPGSNFSYSNSGYMLMLLIVERAS
ncbi:MAG: beta-lactamase family protein, partial [Saprospiraceae bacterium]|nr:beta-lactamase family protein [Saprospiraceae bacterium]